MIELGTPCIASVFTDVETEALNGAIVQQGAPDCCSPVLASPFPYGFSLIPGSSETLGDLGL